MKLKGIKAMIDTVCLLIPKDKMFYLAGVSSWELFSKTEQYSKFVRNPSKAERETGKYFPRLTGYKRQFSQEENVRIEFSVPKLLYLNNVDELENKDFPAVIDALQDRLKTMGVIVAKQLLEDASVSSAHFGKNILLVNGYTANYVIGEMGKVNLQKSFDFAKTRFINDGQSLYAHATTHQLAIYDKIADLNKDEKRAIDKDQTLYQKSLFIEINTENEMLELLRIEVRLGNKQKLNSVLESLGYPKNLTFKEIFNSEISKKVITNYWTKIIKERSLGVFSVSVSTKDILQNLLLADKKIKPKQAIYLMGLHILSKDENGIRQLRTILSKRSHDRTWYRMANEIREANELITKNNMRDWVMQIDKSLDEFNAYKHKKLSTDQNLQCKSV